MILPDNLLRKRVIENRNLKQKDSIVIKPYPKDKAFQPVSIDLRLGNHIITFKNEVYEEAIYLQENEDYVIRPGQFLLSSTYEYIEVPTMLLGKIEGKSSLARLGLFVHLSSGFIDPGFRGNITLEMKNVSKREIRIRTYQYICQICFERVLGSVDRPYGHEGLDSHYQDSMLTIPNRNTDV